LELELNQIIPKLTAKTKVEDYKVIEALRIKERDSFFNLGETKYIEIEKTTYSLKVVKIMNSMTGEKKLQAI
jgi:hypothetical protein